MSFKSSFVWGAATAAYQIEGAAEEDGRGPSVWDMFCRQPGKVWEGDTGSVACDHYHRYKEDVGLLKQIGVKGYRFSFSWSRILPQGTGAINEKGLAFYDRVIDELLAKGIQPWATFFHWDHPYGLFIRGGWLSPDSPKWFADYARIVVDRFSDRIQHWMTLNEPQCFIGLGHHAGIHAPGLKLGFEEVLLASHHALLAHGLGVQVIRAHARTPPRVGLAPVGPSPFPVSDSPADVEAARKAMFEVTRGNISNNSWWADPVVLGHYPADGLELFGKAVPKFTDADMKTINQPLDFYGANMYHGQPVKAGKDGAAENVPQGIGRPLTHFQWNVTPDALYWTARFLYERYKLPIVITENGLACHDWVSLDGKVHDAQRIDFLRRYLKALRKAVADGVDIDGYFQWSAFDNFEWAEGYKYRFGLIHVDFETQKRTLKDSALWYGKVIASNGESLETDNFYA